MRSQRLRIPNGRGQQLAASLDLPDHGEAHTLALLAHCFTCHKNYKYLRYIAERLTAYGIACCRLDFTGLGESEGDFTETSFSTNVADLLAAANYLQQHHRAPALMIGHSLGGAATLKAAPGFAPCRAVVTINSPSEPRQLFEHFEDKRAALEHHGRAEIEVGGIRYTLRREFLDDLEAHTVDTVVGGLDKPLLVLHAPGDRVVAFEHAMRILTAARHPKSFVSLDTADHLLSRSADASYAADVIVAWARHYIETLPDGATVETNNGDPAHDPVPAAEEGKVIVHTGAQGYRSEIVVGNHRCLADEPESAGGTDAGPSPYELLAAALGACTGMTLRMYADRKQWPLTDVIVRLSHAKVHAQDCADCAEGQTRIDHIERRIELRGDLSAEQRQRLLEIANRCPVHRTLHEKVIVDSRLD